MINLIFVTGPQASGKTTTVNETIKQFEGKTVKVKMLELSKSSFALTGLVSDYVKNLVVSEYQGTDAELRIILDYSRRDMWDVKRIGYPVVKVEAPENIIVDCAAGIDPPVFEELLTVTIFRGDES